MDSRFEQDDYTTPQLFPHYAGAHKFAEAHVCPECLGHLNIQPAGLGFIVTCLVDGPVTLFNHVSIDKLRSIESDQHAGQLEINRSTKKPRRSSSSILKDLGF